MLLPRKGECKSSSTNFGVRWSGRVDTEALCICDRKGYWKLSVARHPKAGAVGKEGRQRSSSTASSLASNSSAHVSSIRFAASARLAGSHLAKISVAASFHFFAISRSSFIIVLPLSCFGVEGGRPILLCSQSHRTSLSAATVKTLRTHSALMYALAHADSSKTPRTPRSQE